MPQCLIPDCQNNATHNLGIRLRRPDTTAIWAPNCDAYLCDDHAAEGYTIDVTLTPKTNDMTITTNISARRNVVSRTTPIVNNP